ncbi:alpha/beta hydrolase [Aliiroseovarius sp. M344]|uniref:alpha/beta hydrolase n=1 Tax=Aliiroseovarius sp. M344 TaxID=2867010 RepID=UPI0021AE1F5A|nr:alpha/beta hydrolase [Aliiroseovarius sp. M344]UWQ13616.1 alpha/beta hydrolase [Aliiroseovarius sp. M344]
MNFDIAYANADFIPNGYEFPAKWEKMASDFRSAHKNLRLDVLYGEDASNALDLVLPEGAPRGLAVFVHGGYWKAFGRRDWTHLAAGAVAQGFAVALPSYPLAPGARISEITRLVAKAIDTAADQVDGPVYLAGHSAGGHLVARMNCLDVPLACRDRIARIMPISPLGDLRPLMQTAMNDTLKIDEAEALAESPVLTDARAGIPTTVWVGADERPAFLGQARDLVLAWPEADLIIAPDRHHFDVIEPLADPESDMVATLLD